MSDDLVVLFCPTCGGERLAETPPCADGHGENCPDRACTDCGTALLFDTMLFDAALGGQRRDAGGDIRAAGQSGRARQAQGAQGA
jgi:hypothetical protein